jgi:hypothetical protein
MVTTQCTLTSINPSLYLLLRHGTAVLHLSLWWIPESPDTIRAQIKRLDFELTERRRVSSIVNCKLSAPVHSFINLSLSSDSISIRWIDHLEEARQRADRTQAAVNQLHKGEVLSRWYLSNQS